MATYRQQHREHTNLTAKESHEKARRERPASFLVYNAKQRAKEKNIPFNLLPTDITIPEICPVLGIKLVNRVGKGHGDDSPSLDRINPALGYVKGNIQVISRRANTIKSFGTIEEHEKVIAYIKRMTS
jgi:hypothetical protein